MAKSIEYYHQRELNPHYDRPSPHRAGEGPDALIRALEDSETPGDFYESVNKQQEAWVAEMDERNALLKARLGVIRTSIRQFHVHSSLDDITDLSIKAIAVERLGLDGNVTATRDHLLTHHTILNTWLMTRQNDLEIGLYDATEFAEHYQRMLKWERSLLERDLKRLRSQ
jgi:hypothetical protein